MTDVIATIFVIPGTGARPMDAPMEGFTLEDDAKDHAELARTPAKRGVVHG